MAAGVRTVIAPDAVRPGSAAFFETCWRREPRLFRGLCSDAAGGFDEERFFGWCRPPAVARLFACSEEAGAGTAKAIALPAAAAAPDLFRYFRERGDVLTLLLNRTDEVDPELGAIRARFGIPFWWRLDDIVATLSLRGSGIGFHAGHEDGFIVQLRGRRRWRLWPAARTERAYVRKLLGDPVHEALPAPPRPAEPPVFDGELGPGDVLFVPALMGHEGVTLEESISLSIGWRGIAPYHVVRALWDPVPADVAEEVAAHERAFFRLLPDPPRDAEPVAFYAAQLAGTFAAFGARRPAPDRVRAAVHRVLRSAPA